MPKITVIVPVYKVEPYLRRCVDSILAQTFTDFELILVDDGSPDNCGAICDEYAAGDRRIHVIHQSNGGLSAARNAGIDWAFANSDSEWLSFIDSDDWVHSQYLEALYNGAMETGLDVSVCAFCEAQDDAFAFPPLQDEVTISNTVDFYLSSTTNAVVAWGKLYKKELFESNRYPIGKIHEDEFTTYKVLFKSDRLAIIPDVLYAYFINPSGIMRVKWNPKRLDYCDAFDERMQFWRENGYNEVRLVEIKRFFWWYYRQQEELLDCSNNKFITHSQIVSKRMRGSLWTYRKDLKIIYNFYDRFSLICLSCCFRPIKVWVIENDFEPLQNIIRKFRHIT